MMKRVIPESINPTGVSGLDIIPSSSDLVGAEVELANVSGREEILKNVLQGIPGRHDIVILDCPPALGLLTINALVSASSVLVPVQCEYYAMEGLGRLMGTVERVRESWNSDAYLRGNCIDDV